MPDLTPRAILWVAFALAPAVFTVTDQEEEEEGENPAIQLEPRVMARVVYYGDSGISAEYAIEYGTPEWKPEYDKSWDSMTRGKRLRLGKDWWTTLNSMSPLVMGKVE